MKYILLLVLFFAPISEAHSPVEFLDLIDITKKSVVHVLGTHAAGSVPKSQLPPIDPESNQPDRKPRSSGTGFIVNGGYIITNYHVIEGAESIEVYFEDSRRPYAVTVIGSDEEIDIAVLQVGEDFPKDVKTLIWRTEKLRVGSEVWSIGHPLGYDYSITKGIVSHMDRRIASPWQPTIQIDAAINQGNSGGPLLDMDGKLVGINSMIIPAGPSGGFAGIALAIHFNVAKRAIQIISEKGRIVRPLMGVLLEYEIDANYRVRAAGISTGGAAEASGMKVGDLYLTMEGKDIVKINDVFDILARKNPFDTVSVTVLRDNVEVVLEIILSVVPEETTDE